jgi:hypothetical protein
MSSAMTLIVEAYVKLKDRSALEQLQAHRRGMIERVKVRLSCRTKQPRSSTGRRAEVGASCCYSN